MLDTARHFFPKEDILRTLDAMMFAKLNVFHWHISDDESFPLYLISYTNMSKFGAYSENVRNLFNVLVFIYCLIYSVSYC